MTKFKTKLTEKPKSPAIMCEHCGLFWALQGYNLCSKCLDIAMGKYHSAKIMILHQYNCYYNGPDGKMYSRFWNMKQQGAEAKTGWSFVHRIWTMGLFLNILNAGSMNRTPKAPDTTHLELCLAAGYTEWHFQCFQNYFGLKISNKKATWGPVK